MKKLLVIIFIIFSYSGIYSQISQFGKEDKVRKEWFFALRIIPNLNGSLIQTAVVKPKENGTYEIQFVPKTNWIRQVIGTESSKANPEKENLIKKYNVFEIPGDVKNQDNEGINEFTINKLNFILTNLWRVKFSEYPFYNPAMNQEKGWARNSNEKITWMPSDGQMQLLKPYGINNFSDFFVGEHLFDFLKDVTDRDWQNRYIQSAGVYYDDSGN